MGYENIQKNLQDIQDNLHLHSNTKLLGSNKNISAADIYALLQDQENKITNDKSIDEKIYYLEKLLNIFEESKYYRAHQAGNVAGQMGLRYIDTGNSESDTRPITLKASGYAIRAISYTMAALKEALKENDNSKAKYIINCLISNHEFLAKPETIAKFKDINNYKAQKEISTLAQNNLYDFIEKISEPFIPVIPETSQKNSISKKEARKKLREERKKLREAGKKLRRNDDCQLIRRPVVKSTIHLKDGITVTQIFTPVIRMTNNQKEEWEKVKDNKHPKWLDNLPEVAQKEYKEMAKDAFALEEILTEKKEFDVFKNAVDASTEISARMKLRIKNELDRESFKNFDPFFLLGQAASSSNRATPQASNFVQIKTITKRGNNIVREDISYTRSTEAMLDDPIYKKESNYIPNAKDKSPFWQKNYTLFPNFLQKLPSEDESKELVGYTTMTMEQIYYNNIVKPEKEEDIESLSKDLDRIFLKHWGVEPKSENEFDKAPAVKVNNDIFTHKPILFSSSLLTALPGAIENNRIAGIFYVDRNRMMIQQKLAAFDEFKERTDVCGKMITMNFATNNLKKLSLIGFDNRVDNHNKKAAVELTLAVLNNLIVATKVCDLIETEEDKKLGISNRLETIHLDLKKSLNNGSYKIKHQIIKDLKNIERDIQDKQGKSAANAKLAVAATSAFLTTFKQRNTAKNPNEQVMMACYANLMVQNSSGPSSQTDQHCKSGRDRTFATQLQEQTMKAYFEVYNKLPLPDDKGQDRKNFVEIFEKVFFSGPAQENSNQNQHGSFGLQNLTVRNGWPTCLVLGTINPDQTCLLANDLKQQIEKRDPHLQNNDELRNLGKMARRIKMKRKPSVKDKIVKALISTLLVGLSPLFLCCKITGKLMPQWHPLFTGIILFTLATVGAVYLSPIIVAAAPIIQISAVAGASLLFAIGANGLDPDKKMADKKQDIISIALITVGIGIILINPVAMAAIGIPALSLPIAIGIAAITATFATNITKAFMPPKDSVSTITKTDQEGQSANHDTFNKVHGNAANSRVNPLHSSEMDNETSHKTGSQNIDGAGAAAENDNKSQTEPDDITKTGEISNSSNSSNSSNR